MLYLFSINKQSYQYIYMYYSNIIFFSFTNTILRLSSIAQNAASYGDEVRPDEEIGFCYNRDFLWWRVSYKERETVCCITTWSSWKIFCLLRILWKPYSVFSQEYENSVLVSHNARYSLFSRTSFLNIYKFWSNSRIGRQLTTF